MFGFLTCGSLNAQNPGYALEMTVSPDGDGDYRSLQEAINATKSFPDYRITIHLKKGVYKEKVRVYSWNTKRSIIGEDASETVLSFDDHFSKGGSRA